MSYLTDDFGELRLSADYQLLDASEKGGMSYWQGMVFAKLAAAEVLGIRWLQHADAMEKSGRLQRIQLPHPGNTKKNKRADMVGRDEDLRWHVVEAKGFSRNLSPNAVQNAKDQAAVVGLIDNTVPETTSASVTCLWKSPIEIILDDPPPEGSEALIINDDNYWQSYYGGLINYILTTETSSNSSFSGYVFASLPTFSGSIDRGNTINNGEVLKIGLPEMLIKEPSLAPKLVPRMLAESGLERVSADGVAIIGNVEDF